LKKIVPFIRAAFFFLTPFFFPQTILKCFSLALLLKKEKKVERNFERKNEGKKLTLSKKKTSPFVLFPPSISRTFSLELK